MMSNITSEGYFVISYSVLQKLESTLSVQELMEYIEDTRKKVKAATGSIWDSSRCMVSDVYGHPFHTQIYEHTPNRVNRTTYYSLHMWDVLGSTSVGEVDFEVDKEGHAPKGTFAGIIKDMEMFTEGIVRCSHCRKELKKDDVAGRYFAGIYCEECWTTKPSKEHSYKWQEAHETYD